MKNIKWRINSSEINLIDSDPTAYNGENDMVEGKRASKYGTIIKLKMQQIEFNQTILKNKNDDLSCNSLNLFEFWVRYSDYKYRNFEF